MKEVLPVEVRPVDIAAIVKPVEAAITAVQNGRGVIAAAVKRDTAAVAAAMEGCSTTVEASASMETSPTVETATAVPTTAAAMPNLGCQTAGC